MLMALAISLTGLVIMGFILKWPIACSEKPCRARKPQTNKQLRT